jgi:hypothetical protein
MAIAKIYILFNYLSPYLARKFYSLKSGIDLMFSFIYFWQFEDARDAEDSIRGRDGYNFDGHRLRVLIF